ncbi:Odorant binding protein 14 [Cephus cinctus]|uniref:Uncharacterized protein LOC107265457 isoform X1 n=1 Tax=Cephus cinctus TaxID=211228 RepID=A0A3L9LWD5_CEPCN|nr:uncharacterized protein LOC107265457 isoform X1 [Cephus cinctus]RLZ02170.1 Odorant binding protein 14 [Cephus cinctus]
MRNMKVFILLSILCVSATLADDATADDRNAAKQKCYQSTGLTVGDVDALKKSTLSDEKKQTVLRYMACYLQERNILKQEGTRIDTDRIRSGISPELVAQFQPLLDSCSAINGKDPADTTTKFVACATSNGVNDIHTKLNIF